MSDIYATLESDLAQVSRSEHGGGNIEDAIAGNIEVKMLEIFGEAWQALEISRKAVMRLWFRVAGFLLLILLLIVSLIWILPWVSLAYANLYFKLFGAEAQTLAD